MVKTIIINDDKHLLLVQKQSEFLANKIRITLSELAEMAILVGIKEIKINPYLMSDKSNEE